MVLNNDSWAPKPMVTNNKGTNLKSLRGRVSGLGGLKTRDLRLRGLGFRVLGFRVWV